MKEELGDILLQIVFQSRIAEERGEFSFGDVVHTLAEKLLRRHPHVFPAGEDESAAINVKKVKDVTKVWRKIKENEGKYGSRTSALDGIPLALPALERARRMSQRASAAGFDWPNAREVLANVEDRLAELRKTRQKASGKAREEALGDLLFLLVHWALLKGMSAEETLRKANRRFANQFRRLEKRRPLRGKASKMIFPGRVDSL